MLKYFRNRRSMGWLMGSSMLVLVIFAFVAFYVPDFLAPSDGVGSPTGAIAWVDGYDDVGAPNVGPHLAIDTFQFVQPGHRATIVSNGDRSQPRCSTLLRRLASRKSAIGA